jgi:hypothetical protein
MGWKDTLQFTNAMPFFDDTIESKSDGVDADLQQAQNLQQLAFRWKGTICRADGILGSYENDENFQLERYHTWTTWVDLVTQTMEEMSFPLSTLEWRDRLEEFFEIGIQNAIKTSTILQSIRPDNFGPLEDQELIILTPAQLLASRKEF